MSLPDHLMRAADAAICADRLRVDLLRLTGELDAYRGAGGLEFLRDRSLAAQRQMEMIAQRLDTLGRSADPGRYPLSEPEHTALDAARDLRERLAESLARYQRASHLANSS